MISTWLWVSQDSLDQLKPLLLPSSVCWYLFYLSYIYLNKQKDYNLFFLLFIYASFHPSFFPIYPVYLSIHLFFHFFFYRRYLSIRSVYPIHPSNLSRPIHPSIRLGIYLIINILSIFIQSIYLSISIHPIYLSINLFIYLSRKQRPANPPVQRIVLNPVLEQTIVAAESPRRTISQKIKVIIFQ